MPDIKQFHSAMDLVADLNKSHGVTQRGGKKYTMVAQRIEAFRLTFGGEYGIETKIVHVDDKSVIVQCDIKDKDGFIVASGIAEEIRGSTTVNKTSAVENCHTSAAGRALAMLGLSGGEFASANEMEAVGRKEEALKAIVKTTPAAAAIIPIDERVDTLIAFYENCDADKFAAAENKYKKMINSPDITEYQYEQMVEAHDKRKLELAL